MSTTCMSNFENKHFNVPASSKFYCIARFTCLPFIKRKGHNCKPKEITAKSFCKTEMNYTFYSRHFECQEN